MRRRPWKKKTLRLSEIEKLEVPIPIAHPATVAVLVHNRWRKHLGPVFSWQSLSSILC